MLWSIGAQDAEQSVRCRIFVLRTLRHLVNRIIRADTEISVDRAGYLSLAGIALAATQYQAWREGASWVERLPGFRQFLLRLLHRLVEPDQKSKGNLELVIRDCKDRWWHRLHCTVSLVDRGYRIPDRILPDPLVRLLAIFIPKARALAGQPIWTYSFSTEQAWLIFGWQQHPYKKTIIDMTESLIEFGLV